MIDLPQNSANDDRTPRRPAAASVDRRTDAEKRRDSLRLLEETHQFPCPFMFKVIGRADGDFVATVVETLRESQHLADAPPYRTRETPNGKHVSITFEPVVRSAEQVLLIYQRLQQIDGVVMVM